MFNGIYKLELILCVISYLVKFFFSSNFIFIQSETKPTKVLLTMCNSWTKILQSRSVRAYTRSTSQVCIKTVNQYWLPGMVNSGCQTTTQYGNEVISIAKQSPVHNLLSTITDQYTLIIVTTMVLLCCHSYSLASSVPFPKTSWRYYCRSIWRWYKELIISWWYQEI